LDPKIRVIALQFYSLIMGSVSEAYQNCKIIWMYGMILIGIKYINLSDPMYINVRGLRFNNVLHGQLLGGNRNAWLIDLQHLIARFDC
jgi:hypothetical protein